MQCDAACCSVLQRVEACCSVLQRAIWNNGTGAPLVEVVQYVMYCDAVWCNLLQRIAACGSVLRFEVNGRGAPLASLCVRDAVPCSVLRSVLQCVAV